MRNRISPLFHGGRHVGFGTVTPEFLPLNDPERAKQVAQAEELLFSGPEKKTGFAKALFRGEFLGSVVLPYPASPG